MLQRGTWRLGQDLERRTLDSFSVFLARSPSVYRPLAGFVRRHSSSICGYILFHSHPNSTPSLHLYPIQSRPQLLSSSCVRGKTPPKPSIPAWSWKLTSSPPVLRVRAPYLCSSTQTTSHIPHPTPSSLPLPYWLRAIIIPTKLALQFPSFNNRLLRTPYYPPKQPLGLT